MSKLNVFTKYDNGKLRYDLFEPDILEEIVMVLTHGAEKYDDENWKRCGSWSRYYAATMRHLQAMWMGEEIDPDSGLPHLACALTNLMFLRWFEKYAKEKDDRPVVTRHGEEVGGDDCGPDLSGKVPHPIAYTEDDDILAKVFRERFGDDCFLYGGDAGGGPEPI